MRERKISWHGNAGYTALFMPGCAGLQFLSFGVLSLNSDVSHTIATGDREYALVFLSGSAAVSVGSCTFRNVDGCPSVFDGRAHAVYVPRHRTVVVTANTSMLAAVASALATRDGELRVVVPDEHHLRRVGRDTWYREVYDVIDERIDAEHLVVGETFTTSGNWSSYPPYKHDVHHPPLESAQEEVYFYQVESAQGFALQRIYTDDGLLDETYAVSHNDAIAINRGYHPVVAAPGYRLYYLWVLVGVSRILFPNDDPAHAWVKNGHT